MKGWKRGKRKDPALSKVAINLLAANALTIGIQPADVDPIIVRQMLCDDEPSAGAAQPTQTNKGENTTN